MSRKSLKHKGSSDFKHSPNHRIIKREEEGWEHVCSEAHTEFFSGVTLRVHPVPTFSFPVSQVCPFPVERVIQILTFRGKLRLQRRFA